MKKVLILIALVMSLSFCNAWAADDVVMQELQTDVSVTRIKTDQNAAEIQNLKGGLPAEAAARAAADADLQNQINSIQLTPGPQGPEGPQGPAGPQGPPGPIQDCSVPPTISYELFCNGSMLNIELSITGSREIAYYAIQEQGGDPPVNIITFVGPDLTSVDYEFTVDPGPNTRTLLIIASDTCGNTSKSLLEIEPNICSALPWCGDGICSSGETVSNCPEDCSPDPCAPGYADCNNDQTDGCETSIMTDSANCGACGVACPTGFICVSGECIPPPGFAICDGVLVNIMDDKNNCGECGNQCANDCLNGICQ